MGFPEIHSLAQLSYETDQWENLQFKEGGGRKEKVGAKRGTHINVAEPQGVLAQSYQS